MRSPPRSGSLLLFDRTITRYYKMDGHAWLKKRNSPKIREDHVKLRMHGKNRIAGFYAHSEVSSTFHRRAYHIIVTKGEETSSVKSNYVLLHYLDTKVAEELSRHDTDITLIHGEKKRKRRNKAKESSEMSPECNRSSSGFTLDGLACAQRDLMSEKLEKAEFMKSYWHNCALLESKSDIKPLLTVSTPAIEIYNKAVMSEECSRKRQRDTENIDEAMNFIVDALSEDDNGLPNVEALSIESSHVLREKDYEPTPSTFESDFNILWDHLLKEVGGSVSSFPKFAYTFVFAKN